MPSTAANPFLLASWLPDGIARALLALPAWAAPLTALDLRDVVLLALAPLFLGMVGLEWWRLQRRRGMRVYSLRDSLASLNLGGPYMVLDLIFVLALVLPCMDWVYEHHRLATIAITPWTFALLYLGVELCYYVFHRTSHRVRWFWCAHAVHHGSEHMNFTTAMRQSWLYGPSGNWLFYLPLVWAGFEPRWVLCTLSLNLAYQFFVHTQWVGRLPAPLEFILNTPSHHRAHHGRNPGYIDHNYGGTLIIFDRLFGTFVPEREPVDYGLVRQPRGHNVLWLTVHEWVDLLRDIARPGPWTQRLQHLWRPPEWQRTPPGAPRTPAGNHRGAPPSRSS